MASSTEQDTTYQTHTEVVQAEDLGDLAPEPGHQIELKTPKLHVKLYRGYDGEVVVTHEQPLIRQKTREVELIPVKIKNKNRTKITETTNNDSNNEVKVKDFSKEKVKEKPKIKIEAPTITDSQNRHKEKKSDPFSLLLIMLAMVGGTILILWFRHKNGIRRGQF
ncbi:hypothetical protein D770_20340 [Flammeovirgaceae bacterium 311]|nr:hypothetical protein D770_20340 [Flammeovirgaceae bacterium 311]